MRRALQLAIVASTGVSLTALWGFWWNFAGYSVSEAFNNVLPHPEEPAAKAAIRLYGICFIVAVAISFRLFVVYRDNYRRK
jgi:hypothetical protein